MNTSNGTATSTARVQAMRQRLMHDVLVEAGKQKKWDPRADWHEFEGRRVQITVNGQIVETLWPCVDLFTST